MPVPQCPHLKNPLFWHQDYRQCHIHIRVLVIQERHGIVSEPLSSERCVGGNKGSGHLEITVMVREVGYVGEGTVMREGPPGHIRVIPYLTALPHLQWT